MILVLYQHHIRLAALFYDSRTKPICNKNPEEPFLEIDVKTGGERSHQSLIIGGDNTQGERESNLQGPQMLGVQEERSYMSSRGERHVHICLSVRISSIYSP